MENVPFRPDAPAPVPSLGHVLLADDDAALSKLIGQKLRRVGYSVTWASSGHAALDLFLADPEAFSLVLTDREMPGMTGEELCRRVVEARPSMPVIVSSGDPCACHASRESGVPFSGILAKPFALDELVAAVNAGLSK